MFHSSKCALEFGAPADEPTICAGILPENRNEIHMGSYRMDMSKMSVRECFRLGGPFSPLLLVFKLFGHNMADQKVVAKDVFGLEHLTLEDVAKRSSPTLRSLFEEGDKLGLEHLFCYAVPPNNEAFSVVYRCARPECLLELISLVDGKKIKTTVGAISPLQGGGELITVLYPRKGMDSDPIDWIETLKYGGLTALIERHSARQVGASLNPLPPRELLEDYIVERNQRAIRRFVARGLFVPVDGV